MFKRLVVLFEEDMREEERRVSESSTAIQQTQEQVKTGKGGTLVYKPEPTLSPSLISVRHSVGLAV